MSFALYFDEDSQRLAVVESSRIRNFDVLTSYEASMDGQQDEEQLLFAAEKERVIYTFNARDFCRIHRDLHRTGRSHAGIIIGEQQRFKIGEQSQRLLWLLANKTADEMRNELISSRRSQFDER